MSSICKLLYLQHNFYYLYSVRSISNVRGGWYSPLTFRLWKGSLGERVYNFARCILDKWLNIIQLLRLRLSYISSWKPPKWPLFGAPSTFWIDFSPVLCSGARPCTQVRIQDLVKGGPQVLRLKVADVAKQSHASEASHLRPGSRVHLRALEAFGFLMLKYAFSHILQTLFL